MYFVLRAFAIHAAGFVVVVVVGGGGVGVGGCGVVVVVHQLIVVSNSCFVPKLSKYGLFHIVALHGKFAIFFIKYFVNISIENGILSSNRME